MRSSFLSWLHFRTKNRSPLFLKMLRCPTHQSHIFDRCSVDGANSSSTATRRFDKP